MDFEDATGAAVLRPDVPVWRAPAPDPTREPLLPPEEVERVCDRCGEALDDLRCPRDGGRSIRKATARRIREASRRWDARLEGGSIEAPKAEISDFDREVLDLHNGGLTIRPIAAELEVTYGVVQRALKRLDKAGLK